MKKLLVLMMLLGAIPAFAKITVFSTTDALKSVLGSAQLVEAQQALPAGMSLSSVKMKESGVAPRNSFQLTFLFSPKIAPPQGIHADCLITAEVQSQVVHVGPNGRITASELSAPVVHGPTCQK